MTECYIRLMDGLLSVEGRCPGLAKKLQYWRKELKLNASTWRRETVGHEEKLYTVKTTGRAKSGEPVYTLFTMPGFAHRVLAHCRENGIEFEWQDCRTPMPEPDYEAAFQGLRDYQCEAVAKMLDAGGGILKAPTGAGKTIMSSAVIRAFPRKEMIARGTPLSVFTCADNDINRKNWEEFKQLFPDRNVGLVSGSVHRYSDDIQVVTLDSLKNIDANLVGVLIVDEMHTAESDSRAATISSFRKAAKWGVSATPTGRFDGKNLVAEGLFGPIVASFEYEEMVERGAIVPIKVYWIPAPPPPSIDKYHSYHDRRAKVNYGATLNMSFNKLVARIVKAIPDEMQTMCMVQYLTQMAEIHFHAQDVAYVHAETDPEKKNIRNTTVGAVSPKQRIETYNKVRDGEIRKILSSYCWKQGVDFPALSVVVHASGGGSEIISKQVPGRACRTADGKECAYVVDFSHPWDREPPDEHGKRKPGPIASMDRSRRKAYEDLGFEQIEVQSFEDLPFISKEAK